MKSLLRLYWCSTSTVRQRVKKEWFQITYLQKETKKSTCRSNLYQTLPQAQITFRYLHASPQTNKNPLNRSINVTNSTLSKPTRNSLRNSKSMSMKLMCHFWKQSNTQESKFSSWNNWTITSSSLTKSTSSMNFTTGKTLCTKRSSTWRVKTINSIKMKFRNSKTRFYKLRRLKIQEWQFISRKWWLTTNMQNKKCKSSLLLSNSSNNLLKLVKLCQERELS